MTDATMRAQLVELFNETQPAHHRAYRATDGADDEWPLWYANYMHTRLNGLIGGVCTLSELVYLIVLVEKERAAHAPQAPWAEYYADFFLQRYGAVHGQTPASPAGQDG